MKTENGYTQAQEREILRAVRSAKASKKTYSSAQELHLDIQKEEEKIALSRRKKRTTTR